MRAGCGRGPPSLAFSSDWREDPGLKRSTTEFDQELGERLRIVRTVKGLTQAELGKAVGLSFQQIQKYEQGSNRVSASMLLQLSRALNTDFSAMVAPNGGSPSDTIKSMDQEQLLAAYAQLSPTRKRLVLDLAQALITP